MDDISKELLLQSMNTQQKISDDISDIKATIKEGAQIVIFLNRDVALVKERLDAIERHPLECPALTKYNAWAFSVRDMAWILTLLSVAFAIWYAKK